MERRSAQPCNPDIGRFVALKAIADGTEHERTLEGHPVLPDHLGVPTRLRPHKHRRRHRPARRMLGIELQRRLLELPEDERLGIYRERSELFWAMARRCHGWLAAHVQSRAEAEAAILQAPAALVAEEAVVEEVGRLLALYWRDQPLRAGQLLPRLTAGCYFAAPSDRLHVLDLPEVLEDDTPILTASVVGSALEALRPRGRTGRHSHASRHDALFVVADGLVDSLALEPSLTVASRLFHQVLVTLAARANAGSRTAAAELRVLWRALSPDFRSLRPNRRRHVSTRQRTRQAQLEELADAITSAQEDFRAFCAEQPAELLPRPWLHNPEVCTHRDTEGAHH